MININLGGNYYTKFKYPAGEMQVRLTEEAEKAVRCDSDVKVTANIRSADDIMELALLRTAIHRRASLELPYLPYSRADRRFVPGDCHGLLTFGALLNSMHWSSVITWDCHNYSEANLLIDNLIDVKPYRAIHTTIRSVQPKGHITVLFPDKGAADRYYVPAATPNNSIFRAYCKKKRDPESGKFIGFEVPESLPQRAPVLIVDDICDGGGTFLGIADAIAHMGLDLHLYVTHGIFSKGTDELLKRFKLIYCTNSFPVPPGVTEVHV